MVPRFCSVRMPSSRSMTFTSGCSLKYDIRLRAQSARQGPGAAWLQGWAAARRARGTRGGGQATCAPRRHAQRPRPSSLAGRPCRGCQQPMPIARARASQGGGPAVGPADLHRVAACG
jgi:hypothetical protein